MCVVFVRACVHASASHITSHLEIGGRKGGVLEATPYGGGARKAVTVSTPCRGICGWKRGGVLETTPMVGGARHGVPTSTPCTGAKRGSRRIVHALHGPATQHYISILAGGRL